MANLHIDKSLLLVAAPSVVAMLSYFALKYQPWFVLSARPPSPRRTLTAFAIGLVIVSGAIGACCYPRYHRIVEIRHSGQRVMAEAQYSYVTPSKSGSVYHVGYRYAVSRRDGAIAYFTGEGVVPRRDVPDVQETGRVAIAYAADQPDISMVNYDDFVFLDALGNDVAFAVFVGFLASIVVGMLAMLVFNTNVIERRAVAT